MPPERQCQFPGQTLACCLRLTLIWIVFDQWLRQCTLCQHDAADLLSRLLALRAFVHSLCGRTGKGELLSLTPAIVALAGAVVLRAPVRVADRSGHLTAAGHPAVVRQQGPPPSGRLRLQRQRRRGRQRRRRAGAVHQRHAPHGGCRREPRPGASPRQCFAAMRCCCSERLCYAPLPGCAGLLMLAKTFFVQPESLPERSTLPAVM